MDSNLTWESIYTLVLKLNKLGTTSSIFSKSTNKGSVPANLYFITVPDLLASTIRLKKLITGARLNNEVKLFLFIDDTIEILETGEYHWQNSNNKR